MRRLAAGRDRHVSARWCPAWHPRSITGTNKGILSNRAYHILAGYEPYAPHRRWLHSQCVANKSEETEASEGSLHSWVLVCLGQTNIGIRNLRGYLVMLCQTYVKIMNILCDSLSTCFLFVSLSRGSTAGEIKYPAFGNRQSRRIWTPVAIFRN